VLAPRDGATSAGGQDSGQDSGQVSGQGSGRWWPDWPAWDVWRLGLIFGGVGPLYFGTNAFLPGHLSEAGRADLISPALTALNSGQLPASLLLIFFAPRLERRVWPFVAAGAVGLASVGVMAFTASAATVAAAAVLGFAAGGAFVLGLTLPPLLCAPHEVARVSGAMFTISYAGAVAVSVASGVAWDLTGSARFAFVPVALAGLPLLFLAPTLSFERDRAVAAARL